MRFPAADQPGDRHSAATQTRYSKLRTTDFGAVLIVKWGSGKVRLRRFVRLGRRRKEGKEEKEEAVSVNT